VATALPLSRSVQSVSNSMGYEGVCVFLSFPTVTLSHPFSIDSFHVSSVKVPHCVFGFCFHCALFSFSMNSHQTIQCFIPFIVFGSLWTYMTKSWGHTYIGIYFFLCWLHVLYGYSYVFMFSFFFFLHTMIYNLIFFIGVPLIM